MRASTSWRAWIWGASLAAFLGLVAVILAVDGAATGWDVTAAARFAATRTDASTRVAVVLGWLGLVPSVAVWAGATAALLDRRGRTPWRAVLQVAAVLGAEVVIVAAHDAILERSTPGHRRRERRAAEEDVVDETPGHPVPAARPALRRRALAVVSLTALVLLVVQLVVVVLRDPLLLAGGVAGLILAVAGAWWLVTENGRRRWLGVGGIALGVLVLVGAVLAAGSDRTTDVVDRRLLVIAAMFAVAVVSARLALAPDLHELDRVRARRVSPRHPVLICNLRSGGGKVERLGLIPMAEELGAEVVVLEPGADLAQLARDAIARGADCLGMAGGDGSQALVASIAVEHDLPFVCVSAGTRNHFALDLGLDRDDPRTGLVALRDGVERRVDYATVGDRLFVNNVSLGVYATVVQEEGYREAKAEITRARLPELLGRQAEPFDLQFTDPDDREVDGAFLVLVSNNPYVLGPSLDVSQRRSLETGRLGVFAVTASTGLAAGRLVARASLGQGARDPDLHQFEKPSFEVRSRSGHALVGIDGESLDLPTPLRFTIHPRGLRLLVPEASRITAEKRSARGISPRALATLALGRAPRRP